jgi:transcriptional regulator with XRE-family HTH domain
MSKLADRLKSPTLRRAVKQRRLVLDFTTAVEDELVRRGMNMSTFAKILGKSRAWVSKVFRQEPNLTFFTAVELADAVDMDVVIYVEPRFVASNVIFLPNLLANDARPGQTAPVTQGEIAFEQSA